MTFTVFINIIVGTVVCMLAVPVRLAKSILNANEVGVRIAKNGEW